MNRKDALKTIGIGLFSFSFPSLTFGKTKKEQIMSENKDYQKELVRILLNGLDGKSAHLKPNNALDGITLLSATEKLKKSPHTIWQLICHIEFWQNWFIELINTGKRKEVPHASDGWIPDKSAPQNEAALKATIDNVLKSIANVKQMLSSSDQSLLMGSKDDYESGYDVVQAMSNHLSYHVGQIMIIRRSLGNYPPPSGGDTW